METKKYLRQNDYNRVILTELIPYEVPIRFTFHHFYELYAESNPSKYIKQLFFNIEKWQKRDFIPYQYSIRRTGGKNRELGLIHPLLFSSYVSFYESYSELVTSLCKKSNLSLRAPRRIAKTYFKVGEGDSGSDDIEVIDKKFSSSFFSNSKYNLLYKFYESRELIELETSFQKCFRTDVSNCFGNIYTHSISWAVNTKAISKSRLHRSSRKTFDAEFDLLARRSNHGETHGILVGSEVSRIFAEIILQEIDVRLDQTISQAGFNRGGDYEIRRYIDDYFIFYNEDKVRDYISDKLGILLSSYKLFVNDSKNSEWRRPFVTPLSIVKGRLSQILDEEIGFFVDGLPRGETNSMRTPLRFIKRLRLVISEYSVIYSDCSAYVLKEILRRVKLSTPKETLPNESSENYSLWLSSILESAFFLLTIDVRFQISVTVSRIIISSQKSLDFLPRVFREQIHDLILSLSVKFLQNIVSSRMPVGVEVSSFLVCLRGVAGSETIAPRILEHLFLSGESSESRLDYFSTISALYFCGGRAQYSDIHSKILARAIRTIQFAPDLIEDTESFCLTLDLISSPSVDNDIKKSLVVRLMSSMGMSVGNEHDVTRALSEFSQRSWLFDWREDVDTEAYFRKKELSFAY